jgi:hypothetical protein
MSLLAALREAMPAGQGARLACAPCIHFCSDPATIEAHLPGLATLSSAFASVRADDGICVHHGRVINGRRRCGAFMTAASGIM